MRDKRKFRLKKFNFHPITTFIFLTIATVLLSGLLSMLDVHVSYNTVNANNLELETNLVHVENLFSFDGIKYIISNAAINFVNFAPLGTLLIALIGVSVAYASGFINTFIKRCVQKYNPKTITFALLFLSVISSLINEVGYVILIPLAALVFLENGRNPLLGIATAFCGVAFGYGATVFVGSMEVNLIPITTSAARLIDSTYHIGLLSNIVILIISSIVLSIVGTFIVENILTKRIGKYKVEEKVTSNTLEMKEEEIHLAEQRRLENDIKEAKGLKNAYFVSIFVILFFIYTLIPGFPGSGMLLDMNEETYLNQLFGPNSYFQDGFTYMVSFLFIACGIAYALGAKTIKNDKELIEKVSIYLKDIGFVVCMIFFASQFISVFKKTNIGIIIVGSLANIVKSLSFTGAPLILLCLIVIAVANLFVTTPVSKWTILAPVMVPMMMQSNISPQFAQFILRAGESITKGFTPLLAYFVIYLAYLNIYNKDKDVITIKKALYYIYPYCLIIGVTWICIVLGWYLIGLPIGPGVFPSL